MNFYPAELGSAPCLVGRSAGASRGTCLLLHGLGGDALANLKELALLRGAGYDAIGIDAPGHGRRFDPTRDERWATDPDATLATLVDEAATELPGVLDGAISQGFEGPFAIIGISLGGFCLWRALPADPRFSVAVPLLGSPCLPRGALPDPAAFAGRSILSIQAEHDEAVESGPTRDMHAALAKRKEDVALSVVPGSAHAVPETQWWGVWGQVLAWLGPRLR